MNSFSACRVQIQKWQNCGFGDADTISDNSVTWIFSIEP